MSTLFSPNIIKASRYLLSWSQTDLSEKSGVGVATIRKFESQVSIPRESTMRNIIRTFNDYGLNLSIENDTILISCELKHLKQ